MTMISAISATFPAMEAANEARFTATRPLNEAALDAARGEWKKHLPQTMGGIGQEFYDAAGIVKKGSAMAMVPGAASMVLPVVGPVSLAASITGYFGSSAARGAVRTAAENRAILAASGAPEQKGGFKRGFVNTIREMLKPHD